jgi:hypothetical protein
MSKVFFHGPPISIVETLFFWGRWGILKCGLCKKEVDKQPMITAEGKCSVCGAKLKPA